MSEKQKHNTYTTKDGLSLFFERQGAGSPIVFLHGGGLHPEIYSPFFDRLVESQHEVISPDLPGHRFSSPVPKEWDSKQISQRLVEWLDMLDLHDVKLVGHSYGGLLGLHAASQTDRISSLTLFDSGGIPITYSLASLLYKVIIQKSLNGTFRHNMNKTYQDSLRIFGENVIKQKGASWGTLQSMHRQLQADHSSLSSITVPVHFVWGKDDELFPLQTTHYWQQVLPQARLTTVEGNHDWLLAHPEEAAQFV